MAAWREVARRIAHEIKNPLTPIQLSAQRLRKRFLSRFEGEERVFDECTAMIIKSVDELKGLVDEFSNFARMPAAVPAPNDLNAILKEALTLYQEAHRTITLRAQGRREHAPHPAGPRPDQAGADQPPGQRGRRDRGGGGDRARQLVRHRAEDGHLLRLRHRPRHRAGGPPAPLRALLLPQEERHRAWALPSSTPSSPTTTASSGRRKTSPRGAGSSSNSPRTPPHDHAAAVLEPDPCV